MDIIKFCFYGVVIGISNVIPGLSGGTMAAVLQIYERLLKALSLKGFKRDLKFILPLSFGILIGIYGFSNFILIALNKVPMITGFAFIGLILGSIPILYSHAIRSGKHNIMNLIFFTLGLLLMLVFITLSKGGHRISPAQISVDRSMHFYLLIFATCIVASFAMVLPGLSGSLVLMLFGTYSKVIYAVSHIDVKILTAAAIGSVIGIILSAKIISKLIEMFPSATRFFILGLVTFSAIAIYPGFAFNKEGMIAALSLIAAASLSYLSTRKH